MNILDIAFSKKSIEKAGKILAQNPSDESAIKILTDFRSLHITPLHQIYKILKNKAKKVDNEENRVILSQRLKRMTAILQKIERFPSMNLSKIQDIGGCRAVFNSTKKVYECQNLLVKSRTQHNPPKKITDYILHPKDSGYRGIHLVYDYKPQNLFIEIQLRTLIQHYWSTAVETVGLFTGQALKSSQGNEDWLYFFRLISQAFALVEKTALRDDLPQDISILQKNIQQYLEKLNVRNLLTGFASAMKISADKKNLKAYTLIILDTEAKSIRYSSYNEDELQFANELYESLEQTNRNNKNISIVLLALDKAKNLQKAYPNYFADTRQFIKEIDKFLAL